MRPTSGDAAEGANRRFATVAANPVDPMRRRVPDYETAGFYCIEISGDRTAFENIENAVPGNKKRPGIKRTSNNRK